MKGTLVSLKAKSGLVFLLAALLWLAGALPALAVDDPAGRAALAWLGLLDRGRYQESWREAGLVFKKALASRAWQGRIAAVRGPMGKLESRRQIGRQARKQLPGAPDGDYLVFRFAASFSGKAKAIETLTLRRQPDGAWRTEGYFIK